MITLSRVLIVFLLAAPAGAERPLAYLLQSDGLVELMRGGWTSFYPAQAGVGLHSGDLLRLADDARAVVLCTDFKTPLWRPSPGDINAVENACPRQVELIRLPDGLSAATKIVDENDVRVLSPRGVVRRDDRKALTVRWVAPQGGPYEVRLVEKSRPIWGWDRVLRRTEREIPAQIPIMPGLPYWVEVRYQGKVYTTEIPFTLIDEETRSRIGKEEETLLGLFTEAKAGERDLAHALYLAHQHLWDEALTLLDGANLAPSAAVELLRGRLALGLGLGNVAEERLTKARELARSAGDVESEAAALVASASAAGDTETEKERLRKALALYDMLGAATQADDVRQRLDVLRYPSSEGRRPLQDGWRAGPAPPSGAAPPGWPLSGAGTPSREARGSDRPAGAREATSLLPRGLLPGLLPGSYARYW